MKAPGEPGSIPLGRFPQDCVFICQFLTSRWFEPRIRFCAPKQARPVSICSASFPQLNTHGGSMPVLRTLSLALRQRTLQKLFANKPSTVCGTLFAATLLLATCGWETGEVPYRF